MSWALSDAERSESNSAAVVVGTANAAVIVTVGFAAVADSAVAVAISVDATATGNVVVDEVGVEMVVAGLSVVLLMAASWAVRA